jgi:response regulator RpfG family c-di-GMP phosphodiesterase
MRTADPTARTRCLIIDDDVQVRSALRKIVETMGLIVTDAADGRAALEHLALHGDVAVCICDVHMPVMDGVAFLREAQQRFPDTGVLMLTGVAEVRSAVQCLQLGALDYLQKPVLADEVRARVGKALEKRELILQNRFYQQHLEHRVRELDRLNKQSLLNGVQTLVHALEAKDAYTSGHSHRVSRYAHRTAMHLRLDGELLEQIRLGGELHDVGKIGTREAVLNKPGPLSDEEFEHIKLHTTLGERILAPVFAESPAVLQIVRSHHERMDGRGFPDGTRGDAIPLVARIVAVADAFDAMTTSRAYRASRTPALAIEELTRCRGTHFDADVVDAFLQAFPDPTRLPLAL